VRLAADRVAGLEGLNVVFAPATPAVLIGSSPKVGSSGRMFLVTASFISIRIMRGRLLAAAGVLNLFRLHCSDHPH
jgi:hypothetical protein